ISEQWKGALTGSTFARLAPRSSASLTARSTAAACPEMTICSGELMFAGSQTSPCAESPQTPATASRSIPRIAAIEPVPTGTASCMYLPRLRTVRTASAKPIVPAATCAEYSPRLCPATNAGCLIPFSCSTRQAATETVRMAGCVFSVRRSWSSGPSKQNCESLVPSASSASSKVWRARGYRSARSFPIPTDCDPWPGNKNATCVALLSSTVMSITCWRSDRGRHQTCSSQFREFAFNLRIYVALDKFRGHADGVLDGVNVRRSVGDEASPFYPEQRCTAVFGMIQPLLE